MSCPDAAWPVMGARPMERLPALPGRTHKVVMDCGVFFITLNFMEYSWGDSVVEVISRPNDKAGTCRCAQMEGIGRLISVGLLAGVHTEVITGTLRGIACIGAQAGGVERYTSCLDAISRLIVEEDKWLNERNKIVLDVEVGDEQG